MIRITLLFFVLNITLGQLSSQIDFDNDLSITSPLLIEMDSLLKSGKYENISSILVAKDGKMILEKYYSDHDKSSLHNTRSATKSLASILAGVAID